VALEAREGCQTYAARKEYTRSHAVAIRKKREKKSKYHYKKELHHEMGEIQQVNF